MLLIVDTLRDAHVDFLVEAAVEVSLLNIRLAAAKWSSSTEPSTASSRPVASGITASTLLSKASGTCAPSRMRASMFGARGCNIYIALYVGDLLSVLPDLPECQRVGDGLKREYDIKDLGEANFILGIQVHWSENGGIFTLQRAYLENILLRLGDADGRSAPTPKQPNLQLAVASMDHQSTPAFRSRYLQAAGSVMYAMLRTQPDL